MASIISNRAKRDVLNGDANLDAATLHVLLTKTSAVTDPDLDFVSDVLATATDELTDASYSRKTLGSLAVSLDDTNNWGAFDAANSAWLALDGGEVVNGALVFRVVTNDADSPWYFWYDLADHTTDGGDFTIVWHADGLLVAVQG